MDPSCFETIRIDFRRTFRLLNFIPISYDEVSTPSSSGLLLISKKYAGEPFVSKLVRSCHIIFGYGLLFDFAAKGKYWPCKIISKSAMKGDFVRYHKIYYIFK